MAKKLTIRFYWKLFKKWCKETMNRKEAKGCIRYYKQCGLKECDSFAVDIMTRDDWFVPTSGLNINSPKEFVVFPEWCEVDR